jgi:hypothetical protein
MADAATAITTTRIEVHLGRRELVFGFMESLHESAALSARLLPQNHPRAAVVELDRLKL